MRSGSLQRTRIFGVKLFSTRILSLVPAVFIQHLLCAQQCTKCERRNSEQNQTLLLPSGAFSPLAETDVNQRIT